MDLKPLLLLIAGHFVTDINTGALPAFLPFVRESLTLSYTTTASIVLAFNVTSSAIQPFFGYSSDRWSTRWLLPVAPFMASLGLAFLGLGTSYAWVLVFSSLSGLGMAAYHPEGFKTVHFSGGRKKATAMSLFLVGGNLGFALGPILATLFYKYSGLKGSLWFLFPGILMAAVFLATPYWRGKGGPLTTASRGLHRPYSFHQSLLPMSLLLLAVVLRSAARLSLMTFIPFYFIDILNRDPLVVGKYLSTFLLAGTVGTLFGGPLADRYGYKKFVLISLALTTLFLYLFFYTSEPWSLVLFGAAGFILISSNAVTMTMGQNFMPHHLGMASGLILGLAMGLGGIGTTLLGWVADKWGLHLTLHITYSLPILGFLVFLFVPYPPKRKEPS